MTENVRVVAHFFNGQILRGTTVDFSTAAPSFQLLPQEGGAPVDVPFEALKAVFFVKDLHGNSKRRKLRGFLRLPGSSPQGIKIAVRFKDGEVFCGYSYTHARGAKGFFMFPADAGSNNVRVYVIASATAEIAFGATADIMVRSAIRRRTA